MQVENIGAIDLISRVTLHCESDAQAAEVRRRSFHTRATHGGAGRDRHRGCEACGRGDDVGASRASAAATGTVGRQGFGASYTVPAPLNGPV